LSVLQQEKIDGGLDNIRIEYDQIASSSSLQHFQIAQEVFKKIFAPNNGAFINIYEKTTQQYYYLICIKRHILKD